MRYLLPVNVYFAGICLGDAENSLHHFRTAGTDQARQAHDFSGMQIKAHIAEVARAGEIFHPQQLLADLRFLFGEEISDLVADHVLHQHLLIAFINIPCADIMRVPEDRRPVCQSENVLKPVRNQDDSNSLISQLSGNTVKLLAFTLGESGGRFIHNQDAGIL